jgi:hypothetical protein
MSFEIAAPTVVFCCVAAVAPLIWFGLGKHARAEPASRDVDLIDVVAEAAPPTRTELLRDGQFWSVAAPFALALSGQVGLSSIRSAISRRCSAPTAPPSRLR